MLKAEGTSYSYREYSKNPLSYEELMDVLPKLGLQGSGFLRKRDPAYGDLGLTGAEDLPTLARHIAEHPTLLQRPIGIVGERAVIGRPVEELLTL